MLKVCETYMVNVDIDDNPDKSSVLICKAEMGKRVDIKTYSGEEAIEIYNALFNKKGGSKK